jgi:hypothetical protein
MIPAYCPQTWEHVVVMAGAVKMLECVGFGAENHNLGDLKAPYLLQRGPIEHNKLEPQALSPI